MKRRSFFIPANACWLNSLANQEVYILNHQNIIYEHTMKLKCEMCPQDATFVVGCGNKTACSRCVTTRKCNPSRERAIEITQQDAKEMPCDICKSNPVSVVCLEDRGRGNCCCCRIRRRFDYSLRDQLATQSFKQQQTNVLTHRFGLQQTEEF